MDNDNQIVVFKLADQDYALPILETREILHIVPVTTIPGEPAYVKGVINLRGRIVPVVDLRLKLGLTVAEADSETKIIVVDHSNRQVGLIVDRVSGVGRYSEDEFEPFTGDEESGDDLLRGIVRKEDALWILLKAEAVGVVGSVDTVQD